LFPPDSPGGFGFFLGFFDVRIPLAAAGAFALPLGGCAAALLADENGFDFGHGFLETESL
jgi:hypothetical protein